jgi:hypothetical protein
MVGRAAAWCEYLEAHARRCYGLLKDDGLRAAQALAAKLERGALDDGFTLRDVRRNQWRSLTTDDAIQAALDWLEDEDWLRSEAPAAAGAARCVTASIPRSRASAKGTTHELAGTRTPRNSEKRPAAYCQ